jgi:hypothetical protein
MSVDAEAVQPVFQLFGDPDARLIAGGHSHTACLIIAMNEKLLDPYADKVATAFTADWVPPTTESYWDYLAEQGSGRAVAVLWSGNEHNGRFLLQPQPPFRVFDPEALAGTLPGADQGGWVPRTELRELWAPTFDGLRDVLVRLTAGSDVYVMCTPPPKSEPVVRAALSKEPLFLEQAAQLGSAPGELRITPEVTRVALWRILRDLLRETAETGGATFVPVPPSTHDERGLLLDEYDGGDVTHANGAYGAEVWRQLVQYSSRQVVR